MIDLVLEDRSRVNVAYSMMDEGNVRRQLALPWVSLCSDEESLAPRGAFLRQTPHPRAYGAFAGSSATMCATSASWTSRRRSAA